MCCGDVCNCARGDAAALQDDPSRLSRSRAFAEKLEERMISETRKVKSAADFLSFPCAVHVPVSLWDETAVPKCARDEARGWPSLGEAGLEPLPPEVCSRNNDTDMRDIIIQIYVHKYICV